jgi:hypothetical protein
MHQVMNDESDVMGIARNRQQAVQDEVLPDTLRDRPVRARQ